MPAIPWELAEGAWIGLTRTLPESGGVVASQCQWTDGSKPAYGYETCLNPGLAGPHHRPWAANQPNNELKNYLNNLNEGCVFMVTHGTRSTLYGQWGDIPCVVRFMGAYCKKASGTYVDGAGPSVRGALPEGLPVGGSELISTSKRDQGRPKLPA
jgi:hypothetical protein